MLAYIWPTKTLNFEFWGLGLFSVGSRPYNLKKNKPKRIGQNLPKIVLYWVKYPLKSRKYLIKRSTNEKKCIFWGTNFHLLCTILLKYETRCFCAKNKPLFLKIGPKVKKL